MSKNLMLEKIKEIMGEQGYVAEYIEEDNEIRLHIRGVLSARKIERLLRVGKMDYLSAHYDEKIHDNVICMCLNLTS